MDVDFSLTPKPSELLVELGGALRAGAAGGPAVFFKLAPQLGELLLVSLEAAGLDGVGVFLRLLDQLGEVAGVDVEIDAGAVGAFLSLGMPPMS